MIRTEFRKYLFSYDISLCILNINSKLFHRSAPLLLSIQHFLNEPEFQIIFILENRIYISKMFADPTRPDPSQPNPQIRFNHVYIRDLLENKYFEFLILKYFCISF